MLIDTVKLLRWAVYKPTHEKRCPLCHWYTGLSVSVSEVETLVTRVDVMGCDISFISSA